MPIFQIYLIFNILLHIKLRYFINLYQYLLLILSYIFIIYTFEPFNFNSCKFGHIYPKFYNEFNVKSD